MMGRYSESAACCSTQKTGINETNKRIKMTTTDGLIKKKERTNCVPNHILLLININAVHFNVVHLLSGALILTFGMAILHLPEVTMTFLTTTSSF